MHLVGWRLLKVNIVKQIFVHEWNLLLWFGEEQGWWRGVFKGRGAQRRSVLPSFLIQGQEELPPLPQQQHQRHTNMDRCQPVNEWGGFKLSTVLVWCGALRFLCLQGPPQKYIKSAFIEERMDSSGLKL